MTREIDPEAVLKAAVRTVHRRFSQFVSREDLEQEAWLWVYAHQKRWDDLIAANNVNWMSAAIVAPCEVYARKERAAVIGYDPSDEQFYSKTMLSVVLPHVYNGTRPTLDGPVGSVDPAEGGTWAVIVIDVERALSRLNPDDQALISMRWGEENGIDQVASLMDWTYDEARRRTDRAMHRLIEKLGGRKPQPHGPDCEH